MPICILPAAPVALHAYLNFPLVTCPIMSPISNGTKIAHLRASSLLHCVLYSYHFSHSWHILQHWKWRHIPEDGLLDVSMDIDGETAVIHNTLSVHKEGTLVLIICSLGYGKIPLDGMDDSTYGFHLFLPATVVLCSLLPYVLVTRKC